VTTWEAERAEEEKKKKSKNLYQGHTNKIKKGTKESARKIRSARRRNQM
jgi:hypothetical protein